MQAWCEQPNEVVASSGDEAITNPDTDIVDEEGDNNGGKLMIADASGAAAASDSQALVTTKTTRAQRYVFNQHFDMLDPEVQKSCDGMPSACMCVRLDSCMRIRLVWDDKRVHVCTTRFVYEDSSGLHVCTRSLH